jgi:hypothetical protein
VNKFEYLPPHSDDVGDSPLVILSAGGGAAGSRAVSDGQLTLASREEQQDPVGIPLSASRVILAR